MQNVVCGFKNQLLGEAAAAVGIAAIAEPGTSEAGDFVSAFTILPSFPCSIVLMGASSNTILRTACSYTVLSILNAATIPSIGSVYKNG